MTLSNNKNLLLLRLVSINNVYVDSDAKTFIEITLTKPIDKKHYTYSRMIELVKELYPDLELQISE